MLNNPLVELYFRLGTEGTESARNAHRVQGRFRRAVRRSGFAWYFDSNHYSITSAERPVDMPDSAGSKIVYFEHLSEFAHHSVFPAKEDNHGWTRCLQIGRASCRERV